MKSRLEPLVSILVPVFNRDVIVSQTLESIISQTYRNWECVLVDDGSTDNSLKVIKQFAKADSRIKLYSRPKDRPKGAASCRNFAFEKSEGQLIQYFDSDDIMVPTMLHEKISLLQSLPDLDFVVSKMGEFDEIGSLEFKDYQITSQDMITDFLLYRVFFLTPGPIFKRDFLDRFPVKFDENLPRRQEREFYTRIVLSQPSFIVSNQIHCMRRIHGESIKSQHEKTNSTYQVWTKFLFYQRLNRNSELRYAGLFHHFFGKEIRRMIFRFLLVGHFSKSLEAIQLSFLLWKNRSSTY